MGQKVLTGDGVLVEVQTIVNENDGVLAGDSTSLYLKWDGTNNNYKPVTVTELKEDVRGYKVYTALLTQDGTNAPVATVLENTIGDIVWSYYLVGTYKGTLLSAFPLDKTFYTTIFKADAFISASGEYLVMEYDTNNGVIIRSSYEGVMSDGILSNTPIEIRVYN